MARDSVHNGAVGVIWVGSSRILGPEQHKICNAILLSVGQGDRNRYSGRDSRELHFTSVDEKVNRKSCSTRAYLM